MQVGRPNFDLSRLPGRSNSESEIKLAPSNYGNMFNHRNQQQQQYQQAPQQNYQNQSNFHHSRQEQVFQPPLNPYNHLQNDSDGSELYYSRNNRNKKLSPPPRHQQQHQQNQQQQNQSGNMKFKILPPGQANLMQMPNTKPPVSRN